MSAVRIGIVGVGLVGKRHLDAMAQVALVDIAGVVEHSADSAAYARERGIDVYPSIDAMLDKGRIDGVIIATPTPLHVEQALCCIAHHCPVLVEKPIATRSEDAARLVQQAEQADVALLVGHHRRYNPIIERAHRIIQDGQLGIVRGVQATCWFYKPDAYFDAAPWRKRQGAGPISVNLVHDIDLIRHLVGEVVSVQAQATPSLRGFENEDIAAAVLKFESGAIGTITVSDAIAAPWSWEHTAGEYPVYPVTTQSCYLIGGSEGSLSVPDLRLWSHQGGPPDWWSPISATSQIRASADPLVNQIQHFAQVIRGDATPRVSGREGLRTLQVVEAIQHSAQSGERIVLPGVAE